MANNDTTIFIDHEGRSIRLTAERRKHILQHPEMVGQFEHIAETINAPESVVATHADDTVHVYHRHYERTPVTSKFLHVVVKMLDNDSFILTAFYSRKEKKGVTIWPT